MQGSLPVGSIAAATACVSAIYETMAASSFTSSAPAPVASAATGLSSSSTTIQLTSLVQSYHPTPLEHAYANYILATHFSIAPPDYSLTTTAASSFGNNVNNSSVNNYEYDNIRLSGRNAAPFLSTAVGSGSGGGIALGGGNGINNNNHSSNTIDRQFLKLAWHMVDPDEIGTLTSRKQFYVLLRLIAMAQAGFFPVEVVQPSSTVSSGESNNNNNNNNNNDVTIATILRIFEQDSHLAVPTPTFAADNEHLRPSVARLLEAYPPPPPPPSSQSLLCSNIGGGYGTNMLSPTNMTMMSVHDAFDALIGEEAKDRPLPSLLSVMEAAAAAGEAGGDVGGGGDRSGGGDVPVENLEEVPQEENGNVESLNMEDEEDEVFGSFEDTTTTSSSVPTQTKHADLQGDFHDHAADYEDKFVTHNNVNDQQLLSNETEYDDDDMDGNFGGDSERKEECSADVIIANRDLHHNMDDIVVADSVVHTDDDDVNDEVNDKEINDQCDEEEDLDGFGDFEVVAPPPSAVDVETTMQVGYGALKAFYDDGNASGTKSNMVAPAAEEFEDDVSFSTFEAPDSLERNQDEVGKKWEEISSCNDIATSTTANNSDNKQYNLSSAFDGLIDVEDAPLPPLGSFYAATMTGDESGVALSGHMCVLADYDGIAAAEGNKCVSEVEEGNYFLIDVSENVQEMTDEDVEVPYAKSDDGKFGKNGGDDATRNGVPSVFDAFGEAQDAPLPSLDPIVLPPFSADNRDSYNAAGALVDEIIDGNDDFGDFESVTEKCNLDDNNFITIDDANANTINESSLFHPLANSNNMLLSWSDTNGVPSTVGVGNCDGLEENMPINRNSASDSNHQNLEPSVDINGEAFHNGNHAQIMNTGANTLNGSDEFGVSGAIPPLHVQSISTSADEVIFCDVDGRVDAADECETKDDESFGQLESFQVVFKDDVHDVGDQLASLELVMNGLHKIEEQDFGRFDGFPEVEHHDGADELPKYGVSKPAIQESNQFESHLHIDTTLGNAEVSAHAEKAPSSSHSDVPDDDMMVEDVGNADDFDEGFGDFSSFEEAAAHQNTDSKGDLETIIRSELGHEFGRLVGLWKRVIIAVEHDMQKGSKMMDSLANNQSAVDREIIIKSKKLRAYICGLAEFVRLVRSITASIGDLLCVANDIEVHETTLSQWNNDVMIADAIVIEYLWLRIASEAVALRIMSQVPHLESVVEIRNQFNFTATQKDDVCQLTLRPRVGGSCTQTSVLWNGKRYMACAANFCANRMP